MPQGAAIAMVVLAVVQAVVAVKGAQDAKSAAKKTAALEQQRLDLQRQEQEMNAARERARLQRDSRTKRASLANRASAQGALNTSPFEGAYSAIDQTRGRELNFVNQGLSLAQQSDDITSRQIDLSRSIKIDNANSALMSGLLEAGKTAASSGYSFGGTETIDNGVGPKSSLNGQLGHV